MQGEYLGDSAVAKQEIIAACNFSGGGEKQTDFKYNLERAPADFGDMGMREKVVVVRDYCHILAFVCWKMNKFGWWFLP